MKENNGWAYPDFTNEKHYPTAVLPEQVQENFDKSLEGLTGAAYRPLLYVCSKMDGSYRTDLILCAQTLMTHGAPTSLKRVMVTDHVFKAEIDDPTLP
jgi:hypothetical protein